MTRPPTDVMATVELAIFAVNFNGFDRFTTTSFVTVHPDGQYPPPLSMDAFVPNALAQWKAPDAATPPSQPEQQSSKYSMLVLMDEIPVHP